MPNSAVTTPATPNKQLYNGGSEWQNDFTNDLPGYYQTFYRNYDAAIGRFAGVDPMAESAESLSSYQYANNNPIVFNDPLGNQTPPKRGYDSIWSKGYSAPSVFSGGKIKTEGPGGGSGTGSTKTGTSGGEPITTELLWNIFTQNGSGTYSGAALQGILPGGSGYTGYSYYYDENGNFTDKLVNGSNIDDDNIEKRIHNEDGSISVTFENLGDRYVQGTASQGGSGSTVNPIDGISQISNMGTILFGGSGIGIQSIRQFADGQGPKLLGRALGFGTQRTAAALSNTLGLINKIGKYTGYAGQALNTIVYFNKVLDPHATLTTGDHVGFWTGTAVWGASLIFAANPIVLGGAVLYGAAELGSWAYNGKSIEQNIFDK